MRAEIVISIPRTCARVASREEHRDYRCRQPTRLRASVGFDTMTGKVRASVRKSRKVSPTGLDTTAGGSLAVARRNAPRPPGSPAKGVGHLRPPRSSPAARQHAGVWNRTAIGRRSKVSGEATQARVKSSQTSTDLSAGRDSRYRDGARRGPRPDRPEALRKTGRRCSTVREDRELGTERLVSRNSRERNAHRRNGAPGRGRGAATAAKMIALMCVADSRLGELTDGQTPVTRTGDHLDVFDAGGPTILRPRVARFDSGEMDRRIREILDQLDTFHLNLEYAELPTLQDHRRSETAQWDRQTVAPGLKKQIELFPSGIVESARRARATNGMPEGPMKRFRQSGRSTHSSIVTSKVARVEAGYCVEPDSSNETRGRPVSPRLFAQRGRDALHLFRVQYA